MTDKQQKNFDGSTGFQAENIKVHQGDVYNNYTLKNKSVIAEVVNLLSALPQLERVEFEPTSLPAGVAEKIKHNNVMKSRYIIETYKTNTIDLGNVYETLEQERPGRRQKLHTMIQRCYRQQLGQLVANDIEAIRKNADKVLENIVEILRAKVLESSNLKAVNEDVDLAVNLIVADAFIECLILENPEATV